MWLTVPTTVIYDCSESTVFETHFKMWLTGSASLYRRPKFDILEYLSNRGMAKWRVKSSPNHKSQVWKSGVKSLRPAEVSSSYLLNLLPLQRLYHREVEEPKVISLTGVTAYHITQWFNIFLRVLKSGHSADWFLRPGPWAAASSL